MRDVQTHRHGHQARPRPPRQMMNTTLDPASIASERADFEATFGREIDLTRHGDDYTDLATQEWWLVWLARASKAGSTARDPGDGRASFEFWFSDEGASLRAIERSGAGYRLMQAQSAWRAWSVAWPIAWLAALRALASVPAAASSLIDDSRRSSPLAIAVNEQNDSPAGAKQNTTSQVDGDLDAPTTRTAGACQLGTAPSALLEWAIREVLSAPQEDLRWLSRDAERVLRQAVLADDPGSLANNAVGDVDTSMLLVQHALQQAAYALKHAPGLYSLGYNVRNAMDLNGAADETGVTEIEYKAAADEARSAIAKARDIVRLALRHITQTTHHPARAL
jgi:uncharacterized membrane protein